VTDFDNYDLISDDPLLQFVLRPTIGTTGRVPTAAQPWPSESYFLHIDALTPEGGFSSEEELNALLEKYLSPGKKPKFPKPKEPWHQAQEIAYQGWDENSVSKRTKAAQKAIKISPDGEHSEAIEHYQIYSEAWKKTENILDWMETYLSNLNY
jgi:hypothetical protein